MCNLTFSSFINLSLLLFQIVEHTEVHKKMVAREYLSVNTTLIIIILLLLVVIGDHSSVILACAYENVEKTIFIIFALFAISCTRLCTIAQSRFLFLYVNSIKERPQLSLQKETFFRVEAERAISCGFAA